MITLKIGNTTKPLKDWGCESPQLVFNSFSPDEFSFTTSKLNFRTAFMDFETPCEIFYGGTRVFCGFIQEPNISKSAEGDSVFVSALGYWDVFNSLYYQTPIVYVTGTIAYNTDVSKVQIFGSRQDVFADSMSTWVTDGRIVSFSAESFFKEKILPYFNQTDCVELFSIKSENVDFNSSLILPYEEKSKATFSDVFSSITKWHPELMSWFDYSLEKPELYLRSCDICPSITVDISRTLNFSATKDIKRHRKVILRRIMYITGSTYGMWRKYKGYIDTADAGVSAMQRNVVIFPIDTCDDNYTNNSLDLNALLTRLKEVVNAENMSGSVGIFDRDLRNRYVGKRLNISNSRDNLDNLNIPIQSDVIDLTSGERTLTLGASNEKDACGLIERMEWLMSEKRNIGADLSGE